MNIFARIADFFRRLFRHGDSSSPAPSVEPDLFVPGKRWVISFGGSGDEVCRFINIRFLPGWGVTEIKDMVDDVRRTKALGLDEVTMLTDVLCWSRDGIPVTYLGTATAQANVRALCDALKAEGLLSMVKFWWAPDEPARDSQISEADFRQWAVDLLAVTAEYPELAGVGIIVIYGDEHDKRLAQDLMTGIGLDNYGKAAGVLNDLNAIETRADQFVVCVPGMYSLDNKPMVIEEFRDWMRSHPRCRMMCVFVYDPAQKGYGYNGTADRVLAVADDIKSWSVPAL